MAIKKISPQLKGHTCRFKAFSRRSLPASTSINISLGAATFFLGQVAFSL
jgi:hypothetical protein